MKSLREAVSLTSPLEGHLNSEVGGGAENHPLGAIGSLVEKIEEYRSTLEQMDQHVGVFYLRETMKPGSQVSTVNFCCV